MRPRAQPALADPDKGPLGGDFGCGPPPDVLIEDSVIAAARIAAAGHVARPFSARCSRKFKALKQSGTRSASAIRLIVLHSTEGSTAAGAAVWFTNPEAKGSAHYCVDDHECYKPLPEDTIPWGAPGANISGLHIEVAGFAVWSRDEWLEHKKGLRRAAFKAARLAAKYDIPTKLLSNGQLHAGKRGFVTHAQCSDVFGGSHTDPGAGFPLKRFMRWVNEFSQDEPPPPPPPGPADPPTPAPRRLSESSRLLAAPRARAETLVKYVLERDHAPRPDEDARRVAELYFRLSTAGGLDPLVPVAQMVLETNNLKSDWSRPPFRNLAGIGVTSSDSDPDDVPRFRTWKAAVTAHVGRLMAYAVPIGQETSAQAKLIEAALAARPLPPSLRGAVTKVGGLEGTWATGDGYASAISRLGNEIRRA